MESTVQLSSNTAARSGYDSLPWELSTDWIPDPWAWQDLVPHRLPMDFLWSSLDRESVFFMSVPLIGGRVRTVPLLQPGTRILLHNLVLHVSRQLRHTLPKGVFGYRLTSDNRFEHYRIEYKRKAEQEEILSKSYPLVVETDVCNFFKSISTQKIERLLPTTFVNTNTGHALIRALEMMERRLGYALPEGYSWSRALANHLLHHLDETIAHPFTRWIDDYRIFVSTNSQADTILDQLRVKAGSVGLELNESKTRVIPISDLNSTYSSSLGSHGDNIDFDTFKGCVWNLDSQPTGKTERLLRHWIKEGAVNCDRQLPEILQQAPTDSLSGALIPRLAWLLARTADTQASQELLTRLMAYRDHVQAWRQCRLAAALWYFPRSTWIQSSGFLDEGVSLQPVQAISMARPTARFDKKLISLQPLEKLAPEWQERIVSLAQKEVDAPGSVEGEFGGPPIKSWL